MTTVAVIPCLNEEKHIADVVTKTKQYADVVLVTDGGSTDKSVELAALAGASVYVGNTNKKRGYGANLRAGIIRAQRINKVRVIAILDGDGQHDPNDLPSLLSPIYAGQADATMGCRAGQDGMPAYRRFGNQVLSLACNIGSPVKCPDAVTGFWAIRRDAIPQLIETQWGICIELLVKLRASGKRIKSVPVRPIYHKNYKDNSTLPPVKLAWLLMLAIMKWRWRCRS